MLVMALALCSLTKSWKKLWAFELWKKSEDSCILNTVQKSKKTDMIYRLGGK